MSVIKQKQALQGAIQHGLHAMPETCIPKLESLKTLSSFEFF